MERKLRFEFLKILQNGRNQIVSQAARIVKMMLCSAMDEEMKRFLRTAGSATSPQRDMTRSKIFDMTKIRIIRARYARNGIKTKRVERVNSNQKLPRKFTNCGRNRRRLRHSKTGGGRRRTRKTTMTRRRARARSGSIATTISSPGTFSVISDFISVSAS